MLVDALHPDGAEKNLLQVSLCADYIFFAFCQKSIKEANLKEKNEAQTKIFFKSY